MRSDNRADWSCGTRRPDRIEIGLECTAWEEREHRQQGVRLHVTFLKEA